MDLFFNELSLDGVESISKESVIVLAKVYRALQKFNITTCRISSVDYQKMFQMLQRMPDSRNIINFYFSFFRVPYESKAVEEEQDTYLSHEWIYEHRVCVGFALACILNSAGLSIYGTLWDDAYVHITKDEENIAVRNISTEQHVEAHIPYMQSEKIELLESDLSVADKKISLRSDHGIDVLMDFSKRLLRCPYVTGVINSLPFNPHARKFIKEVYDNGLIEIVLPWTDEGYGIVVRTTGRNIRETEKIGEILNERYGGL